MIVALYIRVSTEDQLEFSPDAQKRALLEYAKKNGYQVDDRYIFIDEGISGTSAKKRPAFMEMIGTAKKKPKPFDAILVHKFDRFARSREDSVVYKSLLRKECGIKVISITEQMEDDKFSVILEAMLEAMAEYYSLNLADEVMKGMKEKARRGGLQSKSTLGYDIVDNKRVINKEEAEIVKKIYSMFIDGESVAAIAKHLNILGYKNKLGNPFDSRRIKYLIENPAYIGVNRWNYASSKGTTKIINDEKDWIIVENAHEPIIDKNTWDEAQRIVKTWHKDYRPGNPGYRHWLGGLLRCSSCGATLTFKHMRFKQKDNSIKNLDGYQCCKYRRGICQTSNYMNIKSLEEHVLNMLKEALSIINKTASVDTLNVALRNKSDDSKLLKASIDKLNHKMTLAKKAYLNEIDTIDEYKANKAAIQKEIDAVQRLLDNSKKDENIPVILKSKISSAIELLQDDSVGIQEKNKYLKDFIDRIIVNKAEASLVIKFFI